MTVNTIDFDSSQSRSAAKAIAATDLGFAVSTDDQFISMSQPSAGYAFEYDHANAS